MNRSILLIALLGLTAVSLAHADESSVCTSMCGSEKEQCTVRARKMIELDKSPSGPERNPFARTAAHSGPKWSESARVTERIATRERYRERVDACNATHLRCSRACTAESAAVLDQALSAK